MATAARTDTTSTPKVTCPYCLKPARLATGRDVYPHRPELHRSVFWRCVPCQAHVGCHRGTSQPLGRLADRALRAAKQAAHQAFDPLWTSGGMSRTDAYRWLAYQLGIEMEACHIGMFDVELCRRVVAVVAERGKD